MRIAIDAGELAGKPTGVGRYLSELLSAWGRLDAAAAHEFVLCTPAPIQTPLPARLRCSVDVSPGRGTRWQQFALPRLLRAARADVLLAPGYTGPLLSRVPMVVSMHDVSFAAHPEWFGAREGLKLRTLARLSARRAAKVVTCSEFSKREIVRYLHVDPGRIEVIYLGGPGGGDVQSPVTPAPSMAAARDGLVLYVGSIFSRRHLPELIDGFSRLAVRHPHLRLEIVGENRSTPHVDLQAHMAQSPVAGRIRAHDYVPDDHLASLYGRAAAFVFLSDYEGFGLTPLEALTAGVPIALLDTEVAREIYGPAALYVARPDAALIAAALERLLFEPDERARVLRAAPSVLSRYSWEDCARRTLRLLLDSVT